MHFLTLCIRACPLISLYIIKDSQNETIPYSGKIWRHKIWQICPKKSYWHFFKFGRFSRKHLFLALFAVVSGTQKCLVALTRPFSVAYFPIFAVSSIEGLISVGTLSSTAFLYFYLLQGFLYSTVFPQNKIYVTSGRYSKLLIQPLLDTNSHQ